MGNGMADFVSISARDKYSIITLQEFDKYCYYVAGLDLSEKRRFWPKEIWHQYVSEIEDLVLIENRQKALNCLSAIVLNTLHHVSDCLSYLAQLDDPGIFSFAATPLVIGYSTLAFTFKNYDSYKKVVKIRKGEGAK
ncbi:3727_t:CDS:2, partial [Racocetra fulgida]